MLGIVGRYRGGLRRRRRVNIYSIMIVLLSKRNHHKNLTLRSICLPFEALAAWVGACRRSRGINPDLSEWKQRKNHLRRETNNARHPRIGRKKLRQRSVEQPHGDSEFGQYQHYESRHAH